MSEEMTGCEIPGPGTTRPSLSSQWGRADGPPGSGRRLARGTGVGPTGRQDRADGSPGGQGIGPTGRLGGQRSEERRGGKGSEGRREGGRLGGREREYGGSEGAR